MKYFFPLFEPVIYQTFVLIFIIKFNILISIDISHTLLTSFTKFFILVIHVWILGVGFQICRMSYDLNE